MFSTSAKTAPAKARALPRPIGKKFEKDKPVTITDRSIIKRAIGNAFFEVELTDIEQDEMMPEAADETPDPETRPVRRPPGRPPKVKPDAIDSNAA